MAGAGGIKIFADANGSNVEDTESIAYKNAIGFHFTDEQLFTLAAMPGLVGATGRLIYTY